MEENKVAISVEEYVQLRMNEMNYIALLRFIEKYTFPDIDDDYSTQCILHVLDALNPASASSIRGAE